MTQTKILRIPEVLERLGIRETTYRTAIANGVLPKPIPLGAQAVGMPEHELNQVIRARMAGFCDAEIKRLVVQIHEKRLADAVALRAELSL